MAKRSTENRINFTKTALASLKPRASRYFAHDSKTPGLCAMVTPTGAMSFYLYRRIDGRPQRVRIGSVGDVTVDQARRQVAKLNGEIVAGVNPQRRKRVARADSTFSEAFAKYIVDHVALRCRAATKTEFERIYDKHLKRWAGRRLNEIEPADVKALHNRIGKDHKHMANRVRELVRAVYNHNKQPHPCGGCEPFREVSRKRYLKPHEVKRFFDSIAEEPGDTWTDYFTVMIFTGQRKNTVASMEWNEVDLVEGVWNIPAKKAGNKSGEEIEIPLINPVVEILSRRKETRTNEYVFPSTGKTKHIVEMKTAWGRIRTRADLEDVRIHDLRRTLGSWQASAGASSYILAKSLGQRSERSAAAYAQLDLDPVRKSVEAATTAMLAAANGGENDDN